MRNSVLLIGIDGASWGLIRPWIEDGSLPTLRHFLSHGISGSLKSTVPLESGSAWTSLSTGTNPGKHGIYNFTQKDGKLINADSVKTPRIWELLSDNNLRSCVINIPMTYPAKPLNGYLIPCFLTPTEETDYAYPSEIMPILRDHNYRIDVKFERYAFLPDDKETKSKRERILDELYDIMGSRFEVAKKFASEQWDLFMLDFKECDELQHLFWDKPEVMKEFFRKADEYTGGIIKEFRKANADTTVFLVSDHGFAASPTRRLNLRAFLAGKGILQDERSLFQRTVPLVYRAIMKLPLAKSLFKLGRLKESRKRFHEGMLRQSSIYMKDLGLYIDERVFGISRKNELVKELAKELSGLEDPKTGGQVFHFAKPKEEVYQGGNLSGAPDIILLPKSTHALSFSHESDDLFEDYQVNMPGRHYSELYGIFLAEGKGIRTGEIENASILDVFPTILHILGQEIPRNVDGRVLTEAFVQGSGLDKKSELGEIDYEATRKEKERIESLMGNIRI